MLSKSKVLVVDDRKEDGELICSHLRDKFIPYQFFHYDEQKLLDLQDESRLNGIRVVIQDLQLVSTGPQPNTTDYDAVVTAIEKLLGPDNGPWLLVTWSTWHDPDDIQRYARGLFDHLQQELEPSIRPFDVKPINKGLFTIGDHGVAKKLGELTDVEKAMLESLVDDSLQNHKAMDMLFDWEHQTNIAASKTVSKIVSIVEQLGETGREEALGNLLYQLALAESGQNISGDLLSEAGGQTLDSLLADNMSGKLSQIKNFKKLTSSQKNAMPNWSSKLNSALHLDLFDYSLDDDSHKPGMLYKIDSGDLSVISKLLPTKSKVKKFKEDSFYRFLPKEKPGDIRPIVDSGSLLCLDITPPCDHAQRKATWNKYMVGLLISCKDLEYHAVNRKFGETTKSPMLPGFIYRSAKFYSEGEEKYILFSSKLVFSTRANLINNPLGDRYYGKLGIQVMTEVKHWLQHNSNRPGIVELR